MVECGLCRQGNSWKGYEASRVLLICERIRIVTQQYMQYIMVLGKSMNLLGEQSINSDQIPGEDHCLHQMF